MQINAAEEFIEHVKSTGKALKCAELSLCCYANNTTISSLLPVGFTLVELVSFLTGVNQEYDDGFGSSCKLYGTIWYADNTWSSRGEYSGTDCWDYQEVPPIPVNLGGQPLTNIP
jgi:hypothetical protein